MHKANIHKDGFEAKVESKIRSCDSTMKKSQYFLKLV